MKLKLFRPLPFFCSLQKWVYKVTTYYDIGILCCSFLQPLRNRFTEIWCPQTVNRSDLISIIEHNVKPGIQLCNMEDGSSGIGSAIMDFITWFSNNDFGQR